MLIEQIHWCLKEPTYTLCRMVSSGFYCFKYQRCRLTVNLWWRDVTKRPSTSTKTNCFREKGLGGLSFFFSKLRSVVSFLFQSVPNSINLTNTRTHKMCAMWVELKCYIPSWIEISFQFKIVDGTSCLCPIRVTRAISHTIKTYNILQHFGNRNA